MDLTENPKLDLVSEEKISTQKISVSDHINGFQCTTDKSDSYVIDMETFSQGGLGGGPNKETNPNSRTTFSKGKERKLFEITSYQPAFAVSLICRDKKIISPNCTNSSSASTLNDGDSLVATSSSPRGSSTPEKPTGVVLGSTDHASSPLAHHQITITTANIAATTESRFSLRRNSFKRSAPPWLLDPKRILLLFATLSSMGTILLIYFTLSI
ncbi:hypothetical protein PTKIN_Ptkin01aG0132200 [Pterospermum kingtungense]